MLKSRPPNRWWVKIADFGISKRIGDEEGVSTTLKGTIGFIAPELHGFTERGTDYAPDLWSLGEILFQMLTKQQTFESLALLSAYIQDPETFPSAALRAHNVSELTLDFILSAMEPLPKKRITVEGALGHNWMGQSITETRTPTSLVNESNNPPAIDSLSEQLATRTTISSSGKFRPLEEIILDQAHK
jgi:serine/threonine protein kinase